MYVNDLPLAKNFDVKLFADETNLIYSTTISEICKKNVNNKLENIVDWMRSNKLRGGVENTKLEAKAKDTKKNPRPRPRTAFPRTETLEAKDRNARGQGQGHRRKRSQKKDLQNFFSGDLQFIGVPRIFHWGRPKPQIT